MSIILDKDVSAYEDHKIASIFPLMRGKEFDLLVDDIRKNGLEQPILLYEGKILDGRNRYRACVEADIAPWFDNFVGTGMEAINKVWSLNCARRHLDSSQAAMADVMKEKMCGKYRDEVQALRDEAEERKKANLKVGDQMPVTQKIGSRETDRHSRETAAHRAAAAGTNRTYLSEAEKIAEEHPEYIEPIINGEKSIGQVKREIKRSETQARLAELPSDKFRVVYADPPWKYGNSGEGIDNYGPAERHYPSMSIQELCDMDIKSIVEDDAVLYLWVTAPLLEECFPIIKAWGFKYKTCMVWDKVKHNFGHYCSVRHELLLICTRGSCTPDEKKLHDSVQSIERTEHSTKPEFFRQMIDELYPHGKRIELFARRGVEGWEAYGNEI